MANQGDIFGNERHVKLYSVLQNDFCFVLESFFSRDLSATQPAWLLLLPLSALFQMNIPHIFLIPDHKS